MTEVQYLFPEGKKLALTFSYDDGVEFDRRLVERFNHYGFKGTFNLPTSVLGRPGYVTASEVPTLYAGHEVAVHGYHHPFLERISRTQMIGELVADRQNLEAMVHHPVTGLAYPYGTYDPEVIATLRALGFTYARTAGDETGNFRYPQDWLVWRPTCHHHRALEFVEPFLTSKYSLTVLYVWGHSYEFDREANWELVDQIGERLTNQPQVWYATNGEIQHYLECIHRLVFTVAQDAVYNPTDQTIWMAIDNDRVLAIESGKTLRIE